jgi:glucose-6-phosphate dehydrogenase assembly protein OpcA
VLVPDPEAEDALEANVEVETLPGGRGRQVASRRSAAALRLARGGAASIVQPLLLPDLPVFLRWRGLPPFGERRSSSWWTWSTG